ncbi:MAG TPA: hypothetical protein VJH97_06365 [Candidatus Nanoarchaeia archaeon]|nr:hypothetical protein [Candidatus Nanoarchaeia archaeon]
MWGGIPLGNSSSFFTMSQQIRITVSSEIDKLLSKVAKKLGKKKSMLARELMEQKMYDLKLIQKGLEDLEL